MDRIFRFETAVKTGLMVTLALAVFIAAGCPRKQGKSSSPPPSSASSEKKAPNRATQILPAAEVNQNTAAAPVKPVTENNTAAPAKAPAKEVTLPEPPDFKAYESMHSADEKIAFITEYADEHPGSKVLMVYKVLDDNDVDVRQATMEMLAIEELDDPNIVYVAAKGLKDSEPEVRKSEIEACDAVTDHAVEGVLLAAIDNSSQEVRTRAIQIATQKDPAVCLSVLKAGIASSYEDVKEDAVSALVDTSSPAAMDILITGLKDADTDFRNEVRTEIDFLISQKFDTYDQAKKWWDANRSKFNDNLSEKD